MDSHGIEWYKSEINRFKKLIWGLHCEIDKLDEARKNIYYYQSKRQNALEKIRLAYENVFERDEISIDDEAHDAGDYDELD
jgi:hypothetical protein